MVQGECNSAPSRQIVAKTRAFPHTSVMFRDINALNDLSGISSILPEPSLKEGSDIRVLERVFNDGVGS